MLVGGVSVLDRPLLAIAAAWYSTKEPAYNRGAERLISAVVYDYASFASGALPLLPSRPIAL